MSRCGECPSWVKEKCDENLAYDECIDMLQVVLYELSSIDIVRCKECRFCKLEGDDEEGTHYLWCWKHDADVNETDFCSWGERKTEPQTDCSWK